VKSVPSSLDKLIRDFCLGNFYAQISQRLMRNPYLLNSRSNSSDIDEARLSYVDLISTQDANIQGDRVFFDAILKCEMSVDFVKRGYDVCRTSNTMIQWFKARCKLVLSGKANEINLMIEGIEDYSRDRNASSATDSLVPVIRKEDFDKEATLFLQKYCPDALNTPMAVPIRDIAENRMGLNVLEHRITEDFSIFGEMIFNDVAEIYDNAEEEYRMIKVNPGTMIIDPDTFYLRNIGCLNNTIAHECFHWERHRCYHFVRSILAEGGAIACRCPVEERDEKKNQNWTEEDWMEWQANSIAPRILLPREPFIAKADELSKIAKKLHFREDNGLIGEIVKELASFFQVSKISTGIRIKEVGWHLVV
jgi:hypothetical protein